MYRFPCHAFYDLIEAIRAAPEDDLPRLAFADLCDRAGEHARSSFIRFMLASPLLTITPGSSLVAKSIGRLRPEFVAQLNCLRESYCSWGASDSYPIFLSTTWHRGFVREVRLSLREWEKYAPELCGHHPVAVITVPDRRPLGSARDSFGWVSTYQFIETMRFALPEEVIDRMVGRGNRFYYVPRREDALRGVLCGTEEDALSELSGTLIDLAIRRFHSEGAACPPSPRQ